MKIITTITLGAYLFLLPWDGYFLNETFFQISPSFIFLGLAALILLFVFSKLESRVYLPALIWPLIFLLLYSFVTVIWSVDMKSGLVRNITAWSYLATLVLVYNLVKNMNISVTKLLSFYILGNVSVGVFAIVLMGMAESRFTIYDGFNPSWYAAFLIWAIVACFTVYNYSKKLSGKFFSVIAAIILTLFLLLTQGRTAMLALVVAMPLAYTISFISTNFNSLPILLRKLNVKAAAKKFVLLILFVGICSYILYQTGAYEQLGRVALIPQLIGGDIDYVTAGRYSIWKDSVEHMSSNFALGAGANFHVELDSAPHNVYILTVLEYGIIGLVLWLSFLFLTLRCALNKKNTNFALAWLACIFPVLGLGNDILYYKYWWIGLLIFLIISHKKLLSRNF